MSNVERLERAYERLNETGDFDWELLDPDIEWHTFRFAPVAQYRGHAGVREWLLEVSETFNGLRIEPDPPRQLHSARGGLAGLRSPAI